MKYLGLLIICSFALTGCSKSTGGGNNSTSVEPTSSALSMLHARPDPTLLAQVRSQPQQNITLASGRGNTGGVIFANLANLPDVSQASLAPPADQIVHADMQRSSVNDSSTGNGDSAYSFSNSAAAQGNNNQGDSQPVQIASYPPYARNSSHPGSGSLVPPPPAVVLSTQAQPVSFAAPIDVYGNPYNGQPAYGDPNAAPARAPGSLFGMGSAHMNTDNNSSSGEHRHIDFVPIMPSGMDTRSVYKQRDDLKLLWKGCLSSSNLQELSQREKRVAQELSAITIGLPSEPSRGSLNVSQRQIDVIFKASALDRRIAPVIKKLQLDLAQSYYRYLYAFNKYALAQQTVAARKQELDYADDSAEKQRATADWSAARTDADATTDDMKSAEYELASAASAQAARVIIGRVSGVAPSADSLAQGEDPTTAAPAVDHRSLLGSLFHFGGEPASSSDVGARATAVKSQSSNLKSNAGGNSNKKAGKGNKDNKSKSSAKHDKNTPAIHGPSIAKDLTPAPDSSSVSVPDRGTSTSSTRGGGIFAASNSDDSTPISYSSSSAVAFVLKGVSVTPRKSIIRVAIRNNGNDNFTFDPDTVGVREGLTRLPDAMVRADFDTTKVAPSQEISGTITIFGRPWNDRLSVYIAEGGKAIQMRR